MRKKFINNDVFCASPEHSTITFSFRLDMYKYEHTIINNSNRVEYEKEIFICRTSNSQNQNNLCTLKSSEFE